MTDLPANAENTAERVRAPRRSLRAQAADLRARYDALPRNRRWLVIAAAVLVGWMATDELVWSYARRWAAESDQIEAALDRGARRASSVGIDLKRSVATYGAVTAPGPAANGREELARAVDEVMRAHKVAGYSYESRTGQRLKDPDAAALGAAIDRVQADVKFEVSDAEFAPLIADLESNGIIDGIAALRIQKNDQTRRIAVQATLEAWVQATGGRSAR